MSQQRLRASLVGGAFPGHNTVHAVRGEERLGELYRYEVDLSADEVAFTRATGSTVLVTLTDDDEQERFVGGEIESLEVAATDDEGATSIRCRATVVPRAAVLAWRHGYRIHQDLDVPDIVRRVLRDAGVPEEETRWGLGRNYGVRKYCVQYDESDLAFVRRLLEEEGIWFAFEHSADGVVMVFGDQTPTAPRNTPGEVIFTPDLGLHGRGLRLWSWHRRGALTPARVAMNDYDREHPSEEMFAQAATPPRRGRWSGTSSRGTTTTSRWGSAGRRTRWSRSGWRTTW
jgi:type VI secretion system secreted protein VgrG